MASLPVQVDDAYIEIELTCANRESYPRYPRRLLFVQAGESMPLGRASSSENKNIRPDKRNGYFECPVMSRLHAEINAPSGIDGPVFLTDVGSMHGTFINGKKLDKHVPTRLCSGDSLTLGHIVTRAASTHEGIRFDVRVEVHCETDVSHPPLDKQGTYTIKGYTVPECSEDEEDDEDYSLNESADDEDISDEHVSSPVTPSVDVDVDEVRDTYAMHDVVDSKDKPLNTQTSRIGSSSINPVVLEDEHRPQTMHEISEHVVGKSASTLAEMQNNETLVLKGMLELDAGFLSELPSVHSDGLTTHEWFYDSQNASSDQSCEASPELSSHLPSPHVVTAPNGPGSDKWFRTVDTAQSALPPPRLPLSGKRADGPDFFLRSPILNNKTKFSAILPPVNMRQLAGGAVADAPPLPPRFGPSLGQVYNSDRLPLTFDPTNSGYKQPFITQPSFEHAQATGHNTAKSYALMPQMPQMPQPPVRDAREVEQLYVKARSPEYANGPSLIAIPRSCREWRNTLDKQRSELPRATFPVLSPKPSVPSFPGRRSLADLVRDEHGAPVKPGSAYRSLPKAVGAMQGIPISDILCHESSHEHSEHAKTSMPQTAPASVSSRKRKANVLEEAAASTEFVSVLDLLRSSNNQTQDEQVADMVGLPVVQAQMVDDSAQTASSSSVPSAKRRHTRMALSAVAGAMTGAVATFKFLSSDIALRVFGVAAVAYM